MPISIEVTASAVAWYAAIISTMLMVIQIVNIVRDRVNVVLDITPNIRALGSGKYKEDTDYIMITVRNRGKRTVTIQSVGYVTKAKKDLNGLLTDSMETKELMDGKSTTYLVDQSLINANKIKHFFAYDQAGRAFKGKLPRGLKEHNP